MNHPLTRRQFMVLSGASLAALALDSCAPAPTPTQAPAKNGNEPQRGGLLRLGFTDKPGDLNPWFTVTMVDSILKIAIYEPLVRYSPAFKIEPALATSWESSADGLTWTFKLRQGVTFHDGSPFTAEDVVYSFAEILKPENAYMGSKALAFMDKVTSPAADTVQMTLKQANMDFLIALANAPSAAFIVPHTQTVKQLVEKPIGTGPFKMKEYLPGSSATFVRNETYWDKGLPYLDEVRHQYISEMATQIAALSSGELEMMWQINTESIAVLEKSPQINIVEVPGGSYQPIMMSVTQKPFDNVKVRQAMKYLVDRDAFVKAVLQGRGQPGNDQPVTPGAPFWGNVPPYPFDIAKAKALLAEAGYPDGFETTLATSDARPGMVETATVFQEMAKAAGVKITLKQIPADNYWKEYLTYPMCLSSWPIFPSTDQIFTMVYHSTGVWNETGLKDATLDGLIEAARSEKDEVKRQELYTKMQQLVHDEGAVIVPYFRSGFYAHHEKVQDIIYSPNGLTRPHTTWIKQS